MPIAYQYTADGYYAGSAEDYGLLPNNATRTAPDVRKGFVPRWNGSAWEQIEDHKGKEGYVNGEPHTIMTYGPLPEGWSDTPPPPTKDESATQKLAEVMSSYAAAFSLVEAVYPPAEREGWPTQEAEARAVLADPEAETPVLSALVSLRCSGETVAELAASVLEKASVWRSLYAHLTGQQQRMYRDITSMAADERVTADEILAYPVEFTPPDGV